MSAPRPDAARGRRGALLVLALGVAAVAAHSTRAYLLVDACRRAGGRYLADPPRCARAGAGVRPLADVPGRPGAWLLVLGPAGAAGALVYAVGALALRARAR